MSAQERQSGAGRREVAWRLFAAEFDDATLQHSEADEERAPNYVITPTGARVNRLFVVGVLTEVEAVTEEVTRARIVDPTGAFVVYAGQYQPDAVAYLEEATPPEYVALTGKARTYQPDESSRVFTSVRPESITTVDAETRDRWTVQAAAHTLDRIATMAAALEGPDRGESLTEALLEAGVDYGLAAGIPLAQAHYGTTPAYLASLRGLAIDAARLVAGEVDEVEPLAVAPGEGGAVETDLSADADIQAAVAGMGEPASTVGEPDTTEPESTTSDGPAIDEPTSTDRETDASLPTPADETVGVDDASAEPAGGAAGESEGTDTAAEPEEGEFELDAEERDRIEEEYGTEFSTGTEVDDPGEADIETPGEDEGTAPSVTAESERGDTTEPEDEAPAAEPATSPSEAEETESGEEAASEDEEPPDLEEAVVSAMREADDGDGADRAAVVDAVTTAHDVDADAVEEAIQSALMSGKCYEPADGRLKAI